MACCTKQFASGVEVMSEDNRNIVIAIAMEAEAAPFIEHLTLTKNDSFFHSRLPFLAFQGKYGSCNLTVITNGVDGVYKTGVDNVGTNPAVLASYIALDKLNSNSTSAELLINAGTCGGFSRMGAEIGDVFLTTAVANHDRRIPIPSFTEYGIGKIDSAIVDDIAKHIGAKKGICSTSNSLDANDQDHHHMTANEASVKDMEAAAIAWSCELHATPHFGLKVVTDIVDGEKPTADEFLQNLESASKSLQEALPKVIEFVCNKELDEL